MTTLRIYGGICRTPKSYEASFQKDDKERWDDIVRRMRLESTSEKKSIKVEIRFDDISYGEITVHPNSNVDDLMTIIAQKVTLRQQKAKIGYYKMIMNSCYGKMPLFATFNF